jgi:hypothetical protein
VEKIEAKVADMCNIQNLNRQLKSSQQLQCKHQSENQIETIKQEPFAPDMTSNPIIKYHKWIKKANTCILEASIIGPDPDNSRTKKNSDDKFSNIRLENGDACSCSPP